MAFGAIYEVLLNAAMRVCCIQGHYSVPQSRCDPRLCDVSSVLFFILYSIFDFVDVTSKSDVSLDI